ncbi:MAG: serine/threonine protein kinase, partial [Deltaproteobacteria bacterium]|nr:serine/threonine protein kinase [Deltaproteobacteria bacterium]
TGETPAGAATGPRAGAAVPGSGKAEVASPSSPSLPVGDGGQLSFTRIGRYEIAELIGRGGMGEVFRCRDPLLGRAVAVKVMRLGTDRPDRMSELLARFQREAAAAGALQHPGIVAVHDLGRDHLLGLWYIVQELVEGRSLDRLLEERRRLPPEEVVPLGFQLADALAFAHARGIVHRDVKPANVLVRKDGTTKLLDFGIAAVRGSDLTLRDQLLGSPAYMAPERIRGRPSGPAADQFSLGVVLYELLAGVNPFDDETHEGRMVRVLEGRPAPLAAAVPDAPRALLELVGRMMGRRPEDRLPAMDDVAEELGHIGADLGLQLDRYAAPEAG